MEEEKINKPPCEEPLPAPTKHIHFHVEFQSTYIAAALSSRFNHVGVIAIEKHPTEKEREESTYQHQSLLFYSSLNEIMHLNSTPLQLSV